MSTPVSTPHIRGHSRNSFPDDRHNPRLSFSALRRTIRRAELPGFGLSCLCCSSRGVTVSGVSPLHGASPAAAQSRSLWEWCPGGIPRRHLYRPAAFVLLLPESVSRVHSAPPVVDVAVSASWPTRLPSRRDHWGESAPPARGTRGVLTPVPLCPPPCRTSGQKGGVALTTITPPVRCAVAPCDGGTREAQPRFALSHRTREIRVVPRPMRRFGKSPTTTARGSAL